jgi:hypothetical protein
MIVYDNKLIAYNLEYDYIVKRYNRNSHKKLINRSLHHLMSLFEVENVNILCSWFCEIDVFYLKRMGYNLDKCYFYDFDEIIHDVNLLYTENCVKKDVIFDKITMNGIKIHRYCEYTYPIGKIYDGDFILVGCDDESLHICNPITSTDQLIEQNEIQKVYHHETWDCIREYDGKLINYYLVAGCK